MSQVTIKKKRNGLWVVFVGPKKVSEHSTYDGAEKMAETLKANNATYGDE